MELAEPTHFCFSKKQDNIKLIFFLWSCSYFVLFNIVSIDNNSDGDIDKIIIKNEFLSFFSALLNPLFCFSTASENTIIFSLIFVCHIESSLSEI